MTPKIENFILQFGEIVQEENFEFVRIRGEISGLKIAPSGHIYFSLKDNSAVLSAVCCLSVYVMRCLGGEFVACQLLV
jgi:exonuclease VII large subunit